MTDNMLLFPEAHAGDLSGVDLKWFETIRRCGHLNFNERDPLTQDVHAWLDYFCDELKVDTVMPNGGGIMAFYPTDVPFHHRSQFLGSRDLFGEWTKGARERKLRIIARMDCNYAYVEAFEANPEWFEFNADGFPKRHPECPWLYKTCLFSPYFTEQMPAIYREMKSRYGPDAFYTNGWPGTDTLEVCHCRNCRAIYEKKLGGTPPASTDSGSAIYRAYYEIYMERIAEVWKLWDQAAHGQPSPSVYVGNLSGVRATKNVARMGRSAAWFYADNQGRTGHAPIWGCAQQGRLARSVANGRTVTVSVGSYASSAPGWRHSSKPQAEIAMWMAQATASGMAPCYHWLGGEIEDTRWREAGRVFFQWHAANQAHFENRQTLANIAVLYPQSTIAFYGSNGTRERRLNGLAIEPLDFLEGMYHALLDGRFLFDFVHEDNLTAAALQRYPVLILANAACLRDETCKVISEYVRSGGSILATFETSKYTEWGEPREDFGLADLLGVTIAGETIGPLDNSYMHIEAAHPILAGFEHSSLLPQAEFRVPVSSLTAESLHLSVVPHYPSFPPEMVYPRVSNTHEPAAIFREQGASRFVYFSGDVDRTFYRSGNPDFSNLIVNSIRWLLNGRALPATVEGKGLFELFAWETSAGHALHILNYTNPRLTYPYISDLYAVGPLHIQFQMPEGRTVASVRALRAARDLLFKQTGQIIVFDLPSVSDYEVVVLHS